LGHILREVDRWFPSPIFLIGQPAPPDQDLEGRRSGSCADELLNNLVGALAVFGNGKQSRVHVLPVHVCTVLEQSPGVCVFLFARS
ncbi:MAG: hypothetical protein AAF417_23085, partial [Pseudomonadota bacterium]